MLDIVYIIMYTYLRGVNMTTLNATKARANFLNLIDRASENLEEFVVTKEGEPRAVIISSEEYDSWKETVEVLSDKKLMQKIAAGIADISSGNIVKLEDLS